jgi:hypothetical protein
MFNLYPEERHWWSFNDYRAVMNITADIQAKTILEFGPGSSTLSLIEGGAQSIDCCEDNPKWAETYRERLEKRFPGHVRIIEYLWSDPIHIPTANRKEYDMALIDAPDIPERPAVLRYALARCKSVLLPTEDHWHAPSMRTVAKREAAAAGRPITFFETGPLSGGFALIGPLIALC